MVDQAISGLTDGGALRDGDDIPVHRGGAIVRVRHPIPQGTTPWHSGNFDPAGKANAAHTHRESEIPDLDKYTQAEVDAALDGHAQQSGGVHGIPQGATPWHSGNFNPADKADSAHQHTAAEIGLGNVRNVSQYSQAETDALVYIADTIKAAHNAAAGERLLCDTSAGAFTVTLPADPPPGATIWLADAATSWGQQPLTIDGNGAAVVGEPTLECDVAGAAIALTFNGADWVMGG